MAEVAVVLLAAGASRHMGSPKQLLEVGGVPMLRRAAVEALQTSCRPLLVVVGANARPVGQCLHGLDLHLVANDQWEAGIGTSIHAGVAAARRLGIDALVLALGDQPLLGAAAIENLVLRWKATRSSAVASRYRGTIGAPALFDRTLFERLLWLPPGEGCKRLLLELPKERVDLVDCPEAAVDIDTPQEYRSFRAAADAALPS